jgi:hypothetical protein
MAKLKLTYLILTAGAASPRLAPTIGGVAFRTHRK